MADDHDDAGGHGQFVAHVVEQHLELRHHKTEHHDKRDDSHAEQDARVNDGGDHAFAQGFESLKVFNQTFKHVAQLATGLARADHVDEKAVELFRVFGQRLAERGAAFDVGQQGLRQPAHGGFGIHADQHAQGVVERQPGFEHDGQLAGQGQDVDLRDLVILKKFTQARGLCVGHQAGHRDQCGSFGDGEQGQALRAQLLHGASLRGSGDAAFDNLCIGARRFPGELRHRSGPRSRAKARRGW